jgi:hypothetical protein
MSLDKAIQHKKEYRQPYRGGAAVSGQCRHGGSCTYCQSNRQYKNLKRATAAKQQITNFTPRDSSVARTTEL